MTPSGIEPATFRFVAQFVNHCDTAVPCHGGVSYITKLLMYMFLASCGNKHIAACIDVSE